MNVGHRLKQQRIERGLDIKEVAHKLGKSYQYVRQIEEGINDPPTWALLRDFANLYGCSVDQLLRGNEVEKTEDRTIESTVQELIKAIHKLPKYRQRDLLAMAEMFLSRKEKDDTFAMDTVLERVREVGGSEAEKPLLDLFERLDLRDSFGEPVGGTNGTSS